MARELGLALPRTHESDGHASIRTVVNKLRLRTYTGHTCKRWLSISPYQDMDLGRRTWYGLSVCKLSSPHMPAAPSVENKTHFSSDRHQHQ